MSGIENEIKKENDSDRIILKQVKSWLITSNLVLIISSIIVILVSLTTIVITVILLAALNNNTPNIPQIPDLSTDSAYWTNRVKIISRHEWLASPPAIPLDKLIPPVKYVIISHSAMNYCHDQAQCVHQVRYIQIFHMTSKNWADIAYNFLVGGDGNGYEGRGWNFIDI
ncbi:peptidoglycan-recognition protein LC-like isoform X2 [Leptopilina heterotoma]|uniref:peptidoglycan-recognition protein LC-like isoform X2 n=1 Tax=Leptopilina heterotoma TaxID=63436 RepID=UPI001CA820CF|nr:peptidoglycan-recognition protein LC-like isoform X2 [Leptopilina heterotoma]